MCQRVGKSVLEGRYEWMLVSQGLGQRVHKSDIDKGGRVTSRTPPEQI